MPKMNLRKITPEVEQEIIQRYNAGETLAQLATHFGVAISTIHFYIRKLEPAQHYYKSKVPSIYPNLQKELENKYISYKVIANACFRTRAWFGSIMRGNHNINVHDAILIKKHLNTDTPIEVLFEMREVKECQ